MIIQLRIIALWVLLFSPFLGFSQLKVARINVYFEKNSYAISEKTAIKLDRVIDSIASWDVDKVYLHGYTDGDASSDYNKKLSSERCQSVAMYLTDYGVNINQLIIKPHGEEVSSGEMTNEFRKAKERRVQLVIGYSVIPPLVLENDTIIMPLDTCIKDTLLDMGNGVFARMNLCEYEENKRCLSLRSYRYVSCEKEEISKLKLRLGFKKYTKCKNPYIAFNYYIKTCNDSCFKKPLHVFTPTYYFKDARARNRYRAYFSGRSKIKKINGEKYLDMEVKCPGIVYCNTSLYHCATCGKKREGRSIKLKKGIKLIGNYYPNNEEYILEFKGQCIKRSPDDSVTIYPQLYTLDSLVLSFQDSIYLIRDIYLGQLRSSLRKCKIPLRRRFGNGRYFIGFKQKHHYKYRRTDSPKFYKIKPRDLDNLTNPSWKPSVKQLIKNN